MNDILGWIREFWWAVIAAVALGAIAVLWRNAIIWTRPSLNGHWKATFTSEDHTKNEEDIFIKCYFGFVRGRSTCTWKEKNGEVKKVNYRIRGRYKERTIIATYKDSDHSTLDMGVFIVRVGPGGRVANGIVTSYDAPDNQEEFDFNDLDASEDYHWAKVIQP